MSESASQSASAVSSASATSVDKDPACVFHDASSKSIASATPAATASKSTETDATVTKGDAKSAEKADSTAPPPVECKTPPSQASNATAHAATLTSPNATACSLSSSSISALLLTSLLNQQQQQQHQSQTQQPIAQHAQNAGAASSFASPPNNRSKRIRDGLVSITAISHMGNVFIGKISSINEDEGTILLKDVIVREEGNPHEEGRYQTATIFKKYLSKFFVNLPGKPLHYDKAFSHGVRTDGRLQYSNLRSPSNALDAANQKSAHGEQHPQHLYNAARPRTRNAYPGNYRRSLDYRPQFVPGWNPYMGMYQRGYLYAPQTQQGFSPARSKVQSQQQHQQQQQQQQQQHHQQQHQRASSNASRASNQGVASLNASASGHANLPATPRNHSGGPQTPQNPHNSGIRNSRNGFQPDWSRYHEQMENYISMLQQYGSFMHPLPPPPTWMRNRQFRARRTKQTDLSQEFKSINLDNIAQDSATLAKDLKAETAANPAKSVYDPADSFFDTLPIQNDAEKSNKRNDRIKNQETFQLSPKLRKIPGFVQPHAR